MKRLIILPLLFLVLHLSGQRNFSVLGITNASTYNTASEGDLYYDDLSGLIYIGLFDGTLHLMAQDSQSLSLSGDVLSITRGNTVNLAPYINSDNQAPDQFAINGSNQLELSLERDGATPFSVNLTPYLDNTDDQTLTYTNSDPDDNINTLQIEGSSAFDIDDNHLGTDDQTLNADREVDMNGSSLTFTGTQDVIIEADGDVGIGTNTPGARLDVDNGTVRFSYYGAGNVLDTLTGTHPHSEFHLGVLANGDVVEVNTVKSAKIFYPPSIVIDVSAVSSDLTGPGDEGISLYDEYVLRFGSPEVKSPSSPNAIPTYARDELYYYVTDLDTAVFDNYELDDNGTFSYDIKAVPTGNCTWINVVFVVK